MEPRKTTAAPFLLRDSFGVYEYVNADPIAVGLSAFAPESVAIAAGRVMLARLDDLVRQRISFGFETTLASRSFAPWLQQRLTEGYTVHIVFLGCLVPSWPWRVWLDGRPWAGTLSGRGCSRRYEAGLRNFFRLYRPLMSTWQFFDNGAPPDPRIIARGEGGVMHVREAAVWRHYCATMGMSTRESDGADLH